MSQTAATLLVIPTYNERDNVEPLWTRIASLALDLDVLFLDDNSPDGTGAVLDRIATGRSNVFVLHRPEKRGIGSAHQAGIAWAYDRGYPTIVTMDADFTHDPAYVRAFLDADPRFDVVTGSRFLNPDSLVGWSLQRRLLTRVGHLMTEWILRLPYDCSGAFRRYRLDRIPRRLFGEISSPGYSFFFESMLVLHAHGVPIGEIPLQLPARLHGQSKMRLRDMIESAWQLSRLAARHRRRGRAARPAV